MSIKNLVNKKITKKVKIMGAEVVIQKLTLAQVEEIQASVKKAQDTPNDEASSMAMLRQVIGMAVEGGDELTEEDFKSFPIDELNSLSTEIMSFSGLGNEKAK